MQVQLTQALAALTPATHSAGAGGQPAQATQSSQTAPAAGTANSATDKTNAKPDAATLSDALGKLNDSVKNYANGSSLQFSVDPDSQTQIVKVIDTQTKDVIRQIPSEQAIALAKAIGQFEGLLIKDKA